jgi:hypothetical protein
MGPNTKLFERLQSFSKESVPINTLDSFALEHDLLYSTDDRKVRQQADNLMLERMRPLLPKDDDVQLAYFLIFGKTVLEQKLGISLGEGLSGTDKKASKREVDLAEKTFTDYMNALDEAGVEYLMNNKGIRVPEGGLDVEKGQAGFQEFERTLNELLREEEDQGSVVMDNTTDPLTLAGLRESINITGNFLNQNINQRSKGSQMADDNFSSLMEGIRQAYRSNDMSALRDSSKQLAEFMESKASRSEKLKGHIAEFYSLQNAGQDMLALGQLLNFAVPQFGRLAAGRLPVQSAEQALRDFRNEIQRDLDQDRAGLRDPEEEQGEPDDDQGQEGEQGEIQEEQGDQMGLDDDPDELQEDDETQPTQQPTEGQQTAPPPTEGQPPTGQPTGAPAFINPKKVSVPASTKAYVTANDEKLDSSEFQKLRPSLKVINTDEIEEEVSQVDSQAIKKETVDFAYVPVRGWRSADNSVYGMGVISNKIQYSQPLLNHSGMDEIERIGYEKPMKQTWKPVDKTDPQLSKLTKPMREATSLGWNTQFRRLEFDLNYDTTPIDVDQSNLFAKTWQANSLYMPNKPTVPYADPFPSKSAEESTTDFADVPAKDTVLSSAGQGFYNNAGDQYS